MCVWGGGWGGDIWKTNPSVKPLSVIMKLKVQGKRKKKSTEKVRLQKHLTLESNIDQILCL